MRRIHYVALPLLVLLQVSSLQAQNARHAEVPIANPSGAKLRGSPAITAKVVRELGAGDEVKVIRKAVGVGGKGANELWSFVIIVRSQKGSWWRDHKGWILDKYLGYQNRFTKITSWKTERTGGGFGDYSFTIEIKRDGSFIHKWAPCVDCGEKPGCDKGERKVGRECVSQGHLYRYGDFVWARKPTKFQEYFLIDKQGSLVSVYSEDR